MTTAWGAGYRDFVMLDPANERPIAAYNLSIHSLSSAANRAELKSLLLGLAVLKDDDNDKLSDYWEDEVFDGDDSAGPEDDTDGDGGNERLEYALSSDPDSGASLPDTSLATMLVEGAEFQVIIFRRRLGVAGGLQYAVEFSRDGIGWSAAAEEVIEIASTNPYDGTGSEVVSVRVVRPISEQGRGLLRVRVTLP
ncbi:MAG: hypothetical protein ACI9UA_002735 [Pseudoalteromonas tetraodonis]